jgi:hypothetical protein
MWYRNALILNETNKTILAPYIDKEDINDAHKAAEDIISAMGDTLPIPVKQELLFTTTVLWPLYHADGPAIENITTYTQTLTSAIASIDLRTTLLHTSHHIKLGDRYCQLGRDVCAFLSQVAIALQPETSSDTGSLALSNALWYANKIELEYWNRQWKTLARMVDSPVIPEWVSVFIATIRAHAVLEHTTTPTEPIITTTQPPEPEPEVATAARLPQPNRPLQRQPVYPGLHSNVKGRHRRQKR